MRKPFVIALEGIDGSGKSSLARGLVERIENVKVIRHPGYTPAGAKLRELLLHRDFSHCDLAARLLFWIDHLLTVKALAHEGAELIVFDRHPFYSNLAYGTALGTEGELLEQIAGVLRGNWVIPDVTFILDVSPEVAISRKVGELDKIEARGIDYLCRVRAVYLELTRTRSEVVVIDAGLPKEEVLARVLKQLHKAGVQLKSN